jgi:hypothetical protein
MENKINYKMENKINYKMENRTENRMSPIKSRILAGFAFLAFVILFSDLVLASFACGQVNSTGGMQPQWMNVRIYSQDENKFSTCQVSPAENKFCCDTLAIPGFTWKIWALIKGGVFDNETGYVAGPVMLYTTGEGYDVFPAMTLEKVIKLSGSDKAILSNKSQAFLNASFRQPYNFVEIENNGSKQVLCTNCTYFIDFINCSWGMNSVKIYASNGKNILAEKWDFAVLSNFSFGRNLDCKGCKDNLAKQNQVVNMKVSLNLSHNVENMQLREYVPVEWKIVSSEGKVTSYSPEYNLIVWNVSGRAINKDYTALPPKITIFPKKYIFRTELENELLKEDEIIVYRLFSFFSFFSSSSDFGNHLFMNTSRNSYSFASSSKPIVLRPKQGEIIRAAIFSKRILKNVNMDLRNQSFNENLPNSSYNVLSYYLFETDIKEEDIDKILLELKINKNMLNQNGYRNVSLFFSNDTGENGWKEATLEIFDENDNEAYYRSFVNGKRILILGMKEEGFFNKVSDLFS